MNKNLILVLAVPAVIAGGYFFSRQNLHQKNPSQIITESKQLKTTTHQA